MFDVSQEFQCGATLLGFSMQGAITSLIFNKV